ncbi:HK97-gp10 family putative phage morphogenesis protein [Alicyclobacillus dauci]|uniref:Phage virion morphogenesis (Putative tail completion) protein n=1 Tax=Alicyclobacillus dauci TaxID=1475485 RepID=A0ABY6ZAC3_9BACL|nr:HK97-gp10 family putative phage morphogenesis protein [Alicyclobacillus dauci]WAH39472.1 hypothetical protein NZD86_24185 [Alicyclobacillus dauci]WAH39528.1 hypothetical protein NZD86_24485 [Alicyclobacillus dauci]WAH39532.1 hypothetical protein NZD86_23885 [Alicyclobacillus dauci]
MARNITFDELIVKISAAHVIVDEAIKPALEAASVKVKETAEQKFGHYQDSVAGGQFPAWAALSTTYLQRKLAAGSSGDDPLIGAPGLRRDGGTPLSESIQYTVRGLNAYIGTDSEVSEFHEFGTIHAPPRPFLRPALFQSKQQIVKNMGAAVQAALISYFGK